MSLVYCPTGKAREYSPLALNVYTGGCDHGCRYQTVAGRQTCYCGAIFRGELWPSSGTGSRICLVAGRVLPFVPVKPPLDRVHDAPIN